MPATKARKSAYRKEQRKAGNVSIRYWQYYGSAKTTGREWSLSKDQAYALFRGKCFYCGAEPDPLNGIDRKDNDVGYTESNSVSCCKKCNWAKGKDYSPAQYIQHCVTVARLWYPDIWVAPKE
jgi:hypothetical protein